MKNTAEVEKYVEDDLPDGDAIETVLKRRFEEA